MTAQNRDGGPAMPRAKKSPLDKAALSEAVRKTARLRVETVGGDKSRPAETVKSCLNRGFNDLGSPEGIEYILRHAIGYYLTARSRP